MCKDDDTVYFSVSHKILFFKFENQERDELKIHLHIHKNPQINRTKFSYESVSRKKCFCIRKLKVLRDKRNSCQFKHFQIKLNNVEAIVIATFSVYASLSFTSKICTELIKNQ